ncbi:hypothetical protein [Salinivibrio costicola]|uniref:hypothetical protein n=1 Tax=Salinivibrio costicola TaxID=51367 RepID=UPI0025402434|nr:hypothetical protein [Salinivibrio costicola]
MPVTISTNFNTGANFGFDVGWRAAGLGIHDLHCAGAYATYANGANGAIGACPIYARFGILNTERFAYRIPKRAAGARIEALRSFRIPYSVP